MIAAVRRLLLALLLAGLVLPAAAGAYTPPPVRHVFVLVEENESVATTFGPSSPAPYLSKTLVAQGAYLPHYYGIGHSSLDNYIAMVSGQAPNPKTSGDCPVFSDFPASSLSASGQENGEGCVYPAGVPTLMGQLNTARLSWRAYEDGMGADPARESAVCGHPAVGAPDGTEVATAKDQYATRHDPFVYFHDVIGNQASCNTHVVNLNQLPSDLRSAAKTPNYVFITPSLCNDGHDATCANGGPGGLPQADSFLRTWVPRITASPAYKQNGLLIIAFDEGVGDSTACCGETPGPFDLANGIMPGGSGPGGGDVGAVLLSPFIKAATVSSASYNHYSMLGSVEDLLGLHRIADAVGTTAFGPDVYSRPNGPVLNTSQLRSALLREITPSGPAARIGKLVKNNGFSLRFVAPEAGHALIRWYRVPPGARLAKATPSLVATGQATLAFSATRTIKLGLAPAGRRLLKHARRLKLTAKGTFTPAGGRPVSVTKTFVLTA
jgi:hypothetical protein